MEKTDIIVSYHPYVLKYVYPILNEFYGFDYSMLWDEMEVVTPPKITSIENGIPQFDLVQAFLEGSNQCYIKTGNCGVYQLSEAFTDYFLVEEDELKTDSTTFSVLYYIIGIYFKKKNGLLNSSELFQDADIQYQSVLNEKIYPEMMSLYKMVLEAKKKKNRGSTVSITYKQDKIDINTASWFIDDMERYFKERFPDVTLDAINNIETTKRKAGRKFQNKVTNTLIWGTYHLLYNHHSKFKDSKIKISNDICEFIIRYLNFLEIPNEFTVMDIRDWLKHMTKQGFKPNWNLPNYTPYPIQETIKVDESLSPEMQAIMEINQPSRKYDLSTMA